MFGSRLLQLFKHFRSNFVGIDRHRAFNLARVATDFRAPFIKNLYFPAKTFWRAVIVLLIGVLRYKSQRNFFATAANHDRHLAAHRLRV